MRKRKFTKQLTLDELINKLEKQVETLKKFREYEHYFSHTKGKTQCSYMIELRKTVYKELREAGLNTTESARILHVTHSSLISMEKTNTAKYVQREVLEYREQWLKDKVYPYTRSEIKGKKRAITLDLAIDKPWGIEKPYNVCSIYKHHAKINN